MPFLEERLAMQFFQLSRKGLRYGNLLIFSFYFFSSNFTFTTTAISPRQCIERVASGVARRTAADAGPVASAGAPAVGPEAPVRSGGGLGAARGGGGPPPAERTRPDDQRAVAPGVQVVGSLRRRGAEVLRVRRCARDRCHSLCISRAIFFRILEKFRLAIS